MALHAQAIRELAAAAIADEGTVRRAYRDPAKVRLGTFLRLTRAAQQLGLELPPAPPALRTLKAEGRP